MQAHPKYISRRRLTCSTGVSVCMLLLDDDEELVAEEDEEEEVLNDDMGGRVGERTTN